MIDLFIGIMITSTAVIIYIYLLVKIKRDELFTSKAVKSTNFHKELKQYQGYVICAEKSTILYEVSLLRHVTDTIKKMEECLLIDVTIESKNNEIDTNFIYDHRVKNIPSILHITDEGTKEVVNLGELMNQKNKIIVKRLENILRQVK
ncbi:hypothetical protein NQ117_15420 [Paenibacillus sp. SC116]|uniref:hypothetical protein n=1 Tax=Paenibacillus sp. SC116 TaxID=2968986 RepID=UPI00215A878B|nr:hypothetical protein [Paenibacillus sp. SC116]MCR8845071.1 hypothetical protein [Paenibacillus sp. SC116]